MKNKINKMKGFTLVELLIVIALIAILSVAVLATINPVEQANKANDSTSQNDAAEILNAYERYYASKQSYPWIDVDTTDSWSSVDVAWFGRSDYNGAALCSLAVTSGPNVRCTDYKDNPGLLIVQDELKGSFLEKGYTSVGSGEPKYNANGLNLLWVDKKALAGQNSIYVCYIPKAKANRSNKNNLKKPHLDGTGAVDGLIDTVSNDFVNGIPQDVFDFEGPATSMFKCVP